MADQLIGLNATNIENLFQNEPDSIINSDVKEVIVKYNGDIYKLENELGVKVENLDQTYAIITLKISQIPLLYNYTEIEYIELPKILTFNVNESKQNSCITRVQSEMGYNLTGKNVVIGIIDSGVDYTHHDFINDDGTSRILYIWDQTENGKPPPGFNNGVQYDNEQINKALTSDSAYSIVPQVDYVGHGTAVAGIAAGNGRSSNGREKGVAPESYLVVVKLGQTGKESFARTTEIMRAIKYIIDKAQILDMPLAINISFGSNNGSHNGNSLFETYIDAMAQRWKTSIVVATGNEGFAGHHFESQISTGETVNVDFTISGNINSMYVTLWKDFVDTFTFELIAPNGQYVGKINVFNRFQSIDILGTTVNMYYGQPNHYNENQEIFFQFNNQNTEVLQGIWTLKITGVQVVDGKINIWLPTIEEVSVNTAFATPNTNTTLTLPSTAKNVISVGGYNSQIDSFADFSGRGSSHYEFNTKPDLVAPAVDIVSTKINGGYGSFTGTSFAAPFVTGSAALMMQWGIVNKNDNFLYGQRIKAFLRKGAKRNQQITYPNSTWGYGTLCLSDTINYLNNYKV